MMSGMSVDFQSKFVIDCTLREGMQAAGVSFNSRRSMEIAKHLSQIGVDMIEAGHPAISQAELARVQDVVAISDGIPCLGHARAVTGDVEAVARAGCSWVGVFLGIDDRSFASRQVGWTFDTALKRISEIVGVSQTLGLKIRLTIEDASRTELRRLLEAYQHCESCGVDRVCFSDTVGILTPRETADIISDVRGQVLHTPIECHFHDDRGLALANTLAALEAGADWASTSINGLGERCGIVDTAAMLVNLASLGLRAWPNGEKLQTASNAVAAYSRSPVDERRPIVGRRACTHVARLHRKAMRHDRSTYEWVVPEKIGRHSELVEPYCSFAPEALALSEADSGINVSEVRQGDVFFTRNFEDNKGDVMLVFLGPDFGSEGLLVEVVIDGLKTVFNSPASFIAPTRADIKCIALQGFGSVVETPIGARSDLIKCSEMLIGSEVSRTSKNVTIVSERV